MYTFDIFSPNVGTDIQQNKYWHLSGCNYTKVALTLNMNNDEIQIETRENYSIMLLVLMKWMEPQH